jgi:RNA polymerase sigma-70 factor (ECF subfamily)
MGAAPHETAFLAACDLPAGVPVSEVLGHLDRALDQARAAHPDLLVGQVGQVGQVGLVDLPSFAAALGASVAGAESKGAALDALHHGDLLLAHAATRGHAVAVARLEREPMSSARAALGRILDAAEIDDALQALREKLLTSRDGAAPKLAEYAGRGSLAGWLKVVAVRLALSRRRGARHQETPADDEAMLDLPAPLQPELELFRARYRGEFKAAFQSAFQQLEARERNLLRLQFVDDLTVDQIGAIYRVHRATAARWVAHAREALFDRTRRHLSTRLGLAPSQLTSILDLVRSHVDVSLLRLLDDGGERSPRPHE